jgi:putative transposase
MPRGPRLDAPGVLHHVMARGITRQPIFRDDADRDDFVHRLARLADAQSVSVYAWALMPNHFHVLLRTGRQPLARSMRSLLTGYAGAFNRRHRLSGHLFQNRYKSIVCEEEVYLLELVRYLHLNPLRAGMVSDLGALAQYADSGHGALVGSHRYEWQETEAVLGQFGTTRGRAQREYVRFVEAGLH